jgi:hypothetical protein
MNAGKDIHTEAVGGEWSFSRLGESGLLCCVDGWMNGCQSIITTSVRCASPINGEHVRRGERRGGDEEDIWSMDEREPTPFQEKKKKTETFYFSVVSAGGTRTESLNCALSCAESYLPCFVQ